MAADLSLDGSERVAVRLHKLEELAAATAVRLYMCGFGRVTEARFCELAMAAKLNLAGFERRAAGLKVDCFEQVGVVVQGEAVTGGAALFEVGAARRRRKMTCRHLS